MNLYQARRLIDTTLAQLEQAAHRPIFDEWVLVRVAGGRLDVLAYAGKRRNPTGESFHHDISTVIGDLLRHPHLPGEFDFTKAGRQELFDAFLTAGEGLFVLFNNTVETTLDFTGGPLWRGAQKHFVAMSEAFQADPLVV